ncbi:unnamed protein product, partial [Owenia fusiformis]
TNETSDVSKGTRSLSIKTKQIKVNTKIWNKIMRPRAEKSFPYFLWSLVKSRDISTVQWHTTGKAIVIDRKVFKNESAKHNISDDDKFENFIEKLEEHGFQKIWIKEQDDASSVRFYVYWHPRFLKENKKALRDIKCKATAEPNNGNRLEAESDKLEKEREHPESSSDQNAARQDNTLRRGDHVNVSNSQNNRSGQYVTSGFGPLSRNRAYVQVPSVYMDSSAYRGYTARQCPCQSLLYRPLHCVCKFQLKQPGLQHTNTQTIQQNQRMRQHDMQQPILNIVPKSEPTSQLNGNPIPIQSIQPVQQAGTVLQPSIQLTRPMMQTIPWLIRLNQQMNMQATSTVQIMKNQLLLQPQKNPTNQTLLPVNCQLQRTSSSQMVQPGSHIHTNTKRKGTQKPSQMAVQPMPYIPDIHTNNNVFSQQSRLVRQNQVIQRPLQRGSIKKLPLKSIQSMQKQQRAKPYYTRKSYPRSSTLPRSVLNVMKQMQDMTLETRPRVNETLVKQLNLTTSDEKAAKAELPQIKSGRESNKDSRDSRRKRKAWLVKWKKTTEKMSAIEKGRLAKALALLKRRHFGKTRQLNRTTGLDRRASGVAVDVTSTSVGTVDNVANKETQTIGGDINNGEKKSKLTPLEEQKQKKVVKDGSAACYNEVRININNEDVRPDIASLPTTHVIEIKEEHGIHDVPVVEYAIDESGLVLPTIPITELKDDQGLHVTDTYFEKSKQAQPVIPIIEIKDDQSTDVIDADIEELNMTLPRIPLIEIRDDDNEDTNDINNQCPTTADVGSYPIVNRSNSSNESVFAVHQSISQTHQYLYKTKKQMKAKSKRNCKHMVMDMKSSQKYMLFQSGLNNSNRFKPSVKEYTLSFKCDDRDPIVRDVLNNINRQIPMVNLYKS